MKLIPAMDLMDRAPVRLSKGDFTARTDYETGARAALESFRGAGADIAHVVDLDGARAGEPRQHDFIASLTDIMPLQVAGGFRTLDQVGRMLVAGARRVVIGSLALKDPTLFAEMLNSFGADAITLALDVRLTNDGAMVATHGWAETSGQTLDDVVSNFPRIRHVLVTDIDKDGMLAGPNLALYRSLAVTYQGLEIQASGGVSSLDDLAALRDAGLAGAIVGKALWEDRIQLTDGLSVAGR
ncbi:1-(5-phosphoribosyl)-5-[(5-phosphoribosylamino)methylideneamino]imidazole-4-carboxamide isomerase [Sphingomicrobium flavum]|uniref:1-(5-phosphoribosyl)-5-[(5- phosphoribosylamino)methylideneamino]imidazole-4- carboxamide isomerase n=1 Tax=Sphingomicrobium flavum TaxID=1229164 RepID=UPI0021AD5E3F|nr:1-(5-phosphoribosyl)-5-[(5-phosphoribosylamino)methylideneamino] imidazole-4-carboxamide isomerase [Sphingomicrobium flavum]